MKKILNTVAALIATLCLAASVIAFAACDNGANYTVTLLYEDGSGVAGVGVTLSPNDGTAYSEGFEPLVATTDANGKAAFDISEWSDTATLLIVIDGDDLPANYSVSLRNLANIKDGNNFTLTVAPFTYETVNVRLNSTSGTFEYAPASFLEEGFYEFKSSDSEVSFTLTDGINFNVTEGSNSIYVNYKIGDIYDIGTANNKTSFDVVFIKLDVTGQSAESALELSTERVMAFNLEAGEKVYLNNPYELDVAGTQSAGAPQEVTGSNFKATLDGETYTENFKVGSNKNIELTTADGAAGTVVLHIKAISNTFEITVDETKNAEIGLLERSLRTQADMNPSPVLIWESNLRFSFTIETAGTYKFTITGVTVEDDLISVDNIKSTGLVPVVPKIEKGNNEVTFEITAGNIAYVKTYTIDFVTAIDNYESKGYKQGDKLAYTVKLEKVENTAE